LPRCNDPVGLGANRVTAGNDSWVADISQDCTYRVESPRMKQLLLLAGLMLTTGFDLSFAAEAAKTEPKPATAAPAPQIQVVTSLGNFIIELNAERAPLTVANFLKYVEQGHYSGTIFHRVVANFVIQGGGFDRNYAAVPAPTKVVNEAGNGLTNQRGTVGMARASDPHGADAQFYVNLYDNEALDPNKTRWGYAVFGKVIQGMEVVDKIGNVATGARGLLKEDAPLQPVVIERIERVAGP
jgi:cyclophilin family peptidyl-prolyl cis-trans isomerase